MSCKHCKKAREALMRARIAEASGHVVNAVKAKVSKPRRAAKKTPAKPANRPVGRKTTE